MTVGDLKAILVDQDDDLELMIAVETPDGYVCPDGATIGVNSIGRGIDWHSGYFMIFPERQLKVKNITKWLNREPES